jgi:hypothetical protein
MSETPLGDAVEPEEIDDDAEDPDVPDLSGEADNEPDDSTPAPEVETQDDEATEAPEQNKHEE